jgi:hypothetical protein
MIAHIQQQACAIAEAVKVQNLGDGVQSRVEVLVEELNQLDSRDFVTSERYEFTERRRKARRLARIGDSDWKLMAALSNSSQATKDDLLALNKIADVLEVLSKYKHEFDKVESAWVGADRIIDTAHEFFNDLATFLERGYGGEGSHVEKRTFGWVKNKALRTIVERDYKELMLKVYPSGAWKMTVVAAGSILEAILYDLLTRTTKRIREAEVAGTAPKKRW